jgi:hypothetical protein
MMMEGFLLDLVAFPNINAKMPLQHLSFQLKCYYDLVMNSKCMQYMLLMFSLLLKNECIYTHLLVYKHDSEVPPLRIKNLLIQLNLNLVKSLSTIILNKCKLESWSPISTNSHIC